MQDDKPQILNRLDTIVGHVHGIRRMVAADVRCPEIFGQCFAVSRALIAFETALIECYLHREFQADRRDEAIAGLSPLFGLSREQCNAPVETATTGADGPRWSSTCHIAKEPQNAEDPRNLASPFDRCAVSSSRA
jgi:DNA-binding FrmR family transcriptional regulator